MRFIHVADIHASKERLSQTLSILNTLIERASKGDIDFVVFAGDFWDSTITATKGSGFSDIVSAVRELEKNTCLYFLYGTPSHEPSGSLDAFESESTKVISENGFDIFIGKDRNTDIYFIPEPRRSNYITNSIADTDKAINDDITNFIKSRKTKPNNYYRIVVYHGEVKGALYQNGSSASSTTAISKELLQSLNADYYALGHIHMPQEVFPNAWYSGSASPKNFGETHDGCYNLVTIDEKGTSVERVSFGLPTYETYNVFLSDFTKTKNDFTNKHIRLQFECTKEERKQLNLKTVADEIKAKTRAISVKLEPTVIEGEQIKKSEIVQRKSLVEKLEEYAKEKELKLPAHTKELLKDIQDNTLIKLSYPQHSFELLSLSLRGAIGIRDGQGKEDFDIDFERFDDGVVCLQGNCGTGKSTLIENCHPYPCMLTRDGALKDHFYLKDSHRILVYRDENGLYYRISLLIDGKNKSGKVVYFAETSKDRESWETLADTDGSLASYQQWVNNTFGSIDVFLRTAFFAKEQTKGTPDISATTKSERMELLSKLAGTEHLKEVSAIAKELRKEVEKESDRITLEIDLYARHEDNIAANEEDIKTWSKELEGQKTLISELEKEVSELKVKDAEYQKVKAISETNNILYNQYKKEFDEKKVKLSDFEECVNNKDVYGKIARCNAELTANAPIIDKLTDKITALRKERDEVTEKVINLKDTRSEYELKLGEYEQRRKYLIKQIPNLNSVCPTCGAPLSKEKKAELQKQIDSMNNELSEILLNINNVRDNFSAVSKELNEVDTTEELKVQIEKANQELNKLLEKKEENAAYLQKFNQLYIEWTYEEVVEETKRLKSELNELQTKMDDIVEFECLEDVSEELKETELKLKREQNHYSELTAMLKAAEKENKRYQKELESVADKKEELKKLTEKVTAYNFIEDAFSNNGIPAIELRESAPEIAEIANNILKESYGNKFEIRFGNTSELKTNRKANEDFNILVYDNENGDEKTIDTVSSGERIWIKQALFYAFSIVQMERTGFNFRTRFIDESDGSLDGNLRPKYLNMVTSAHAHANARLTVLISHSQEIKDIAQQIIEI